MSLRALKTLVAIAESGSFAAAARTLNLSQSAISTQMRGLEDELKVALFDRRKRPPVLNEAGKALVTKARELIDSYEDLQSSVAAKGAIEGRIRLGAVGTTLTGILPVVLTVIRERYPSLHIEIVSGFSEELVQQIESRALDAAIVSDYEGKRQDLSWRPFLTEPLVMIAPPDASESNPKRLAQAYPFIRYSPTAPVGRIIDRALRRANLKVHEIHAARLVGSDRSNGPPRPWHCACAGAAVSARAAVRSETHCARARAVSADLGHRRACGVAEAPPYRRAVRRADGVAGGNERLFGASAAEASGARSTKMKCARPMGSNRSGWSRPDGRRPA